MEVFEKIYLKPGIHLREICRQINLSIPSVKNHLDKLLEEKVITKVKDGRNLKFFVNISNRKTIPYLSKVESNRIGKLPGFVGNVLFDILSSLDRKPLIMLVFGSYAKNSYKEDSDIDVLLVFDSVDKKIEQKISIINERHSAKASLVYLPWDEFKKKFFDQRDSFMKEIKENKILIAGIEHWVMLENEKA